MSQKYIVYKAENAGIIEEALTAYNSVIAVIPVEDAVVIRRQDAFAPPALDAYANSITMLIEVAKDIPGVDPVALEELQAVADYFHEEATASWHTERKLPD